MFEREDWKLFRNIDTLCQKAGVRKDRIPMLVIKELVDNALDTLTKCNFGLLPNNGFFVEDEGEGIEPSKLSDFFSINRPMITTKLLRLPTKGALGNGLRVALGSVIATGGKLFVCTHGNRYEIIPQDTNGLSIVNKIGEYNKKGTRIEIYFGNSLQLDSKDLHWANLSELFNFGENYSCKTSAFWYNSESFFELVNAYTGDINSLCLFFEGINKQKAKKISDIFNNRTSKELNFNDTENLLEQLRYNSKPVNYKNLGHCGAIYSFGEYIKKTGVLINTTVKGRFTGEIPYIVEGWIKFQEKENVEVLVNKTPITGEMRTWMSKGELCISGCGLIHGFKSKPAFVILNIITPYMPITSDGKAPNLLQFYREIKDVLNKANRKAKKSFLSNNNIKNEKEIIINNIQNAIDKASGDGKYIFSQRQLYYAIRPYVINSLDKQPEYNYFCRLLTEYENEYGDIEGLYRDPRGTLYHPHLGEEIPLGTIAVNNYKRPSWTFNKILYCEKEGFFPILKDAKFPERFDCALLSSKGYASRAVKDLFDLLGDTDEEILFFCIHDADASGTMIYQTLQEGTLARAGRKVKVINLGLDPWEAIEMGLEIESFESKGRKAVAKYIEERWWNSTNEINYRDWLQENRVELNAMSTPVFINWLETKIKEYDNGKVIPDKYTMKNKLLEDTKSLIYNKLMKEVLQKNNFEELVKNELEKIQPIIEDKITTLNQDIEYDLSNTDKHWTESIKNIAKNITKEKED